MFFSLYWPYLLLAPLFLIVVRRTQQRAGYYKRGALPLGVVTIGSAGLTALALLGGQELGWWYTEWKSLEIPAILAGFWLVLLEAEALLVMPQKQALNLQSLKFGLLFLGLSVLLLVGKGLVYASAAFGLLGLFFLIDKKSGLEISNNLRFWSLMGLSTGTAAVYHLAAQKLGWVKYDSAKLIGLTPLELPIESVAICLGWVALVVLFYVYIRREKLKLLPLTLFPIKTEDNLDIEPALFEDAANNGNKNL